MSKVQALPLLRVVALALLLIASPARAIVESPDRILACSVRSFLTLNSEDAIEARYQWRSKLAERQFNFDGSVTGLASQSSTSGRSLGVNGEAKVIKKILDPALSKSIEAQEKYLSSLQVGLQSQLSTFLFEVNSAIQALIDLQIERDSIAEQVTELSDLDKFARTLAKSRVIDPSDALLVQENLLRFRIQLIEVDRRLMESRKTLEGKTGVAFDAVEISRRPSEIESDIWERISHRISSQPNRRRAEIRVQSLNVEGVANDRWWWPKLAAEGGFTQQTQSLDSGFTTTSQPYAALRLEFNLRDESIKATAERVAALTRLETERARRADIENLAQIESAKEGWSYLKSQSVISFARKENLERLRALQLLKFRSGKLSFLNLNDVMLSLLDARRQVRTIASNIDKIGRDARILLQASMLSNDGVRSTDFFGGCRED